MTEPWAMRVYLAYLGVYEERGCIGVYWTEREAQEALRARQEWLDEMKAHHRRFLADGKIGPMRPWYDIEGWTVGGSGEPSRWIADTEQKVT